MHPTFPWIARLRTKLPSTGTLTGAALAVCALSGLALVGFYRPGAPLESLARMMMLHPAGVWVRSVHYWSAQCLLAGGVIWLLGRLLRRGESSPSFGAGLPMILAGPVILFALWSGFILRGDPAAEQAAGWLRYLLRLVPPGGNLLALLLLGTGSNLTVVFWHHVVTATVVLAWLLRARLRRLGSEVRPVGGMLLLTGALAALWIPGLEIYSRPVEALPWYLAGGVQALQWVPEPGLAVGLAGSALLGLALLPLLAAPLRTVARRCLAFGLLGYAVLTVAGLARRPPAGGPEFVSARSYLPAAATVRRAPLATVAGRPEGCLSCHGDMTGFAAAHQPAAIGCTACHRGNPFTLDATLAHAGMTLTPGNLSIVRQTCATAGCHADIADRLQGALMNTMSGVVAVDKVVFGESRDLNQRYAVARLGRSPADRHLRNLCTSCHLGQEKPQPAAIGQQSRGGGCSACHLDYGTEALAELHPRGAPGRAADALRHHPDISTRVPAGACFGCHSRSGRIATNYEGWHETLLSEAAARQSPGWPGRYRVLDDGRVFSRQIADVHFERGMSCTDCHLASEVMGDGTPHAHEAEAVKIACADCHADRPPPTATFAQLDPETQKLVALRQLNQTGRRFVRARAGNVSYPNLFLDETGRIVLETARGAVLRPQPPGRACGRAIAGHQKLECRTCHSAWAPQCISCHTAFDPQAEGWDNLTGRDVRGAWQETPGDFRADPPVLGVETVATAGGAPQERVAIFVPGMVMTLNRSAGAAKLPDEFHRLYAPAAPHTTVTQGRDCVSCHANPLALGYGRGTLKYQTAGGRGHWTFTPALPRSGYDGLPVDAWIGFLEEPAAPAATRTNVRPFNRQEQQRLLLVGACLQCHSGKEPAVAAAFADFSHYRQRLSPRCVLPDWVR
jgi:hypothetical protein